MLRDLLNLFRKDNLYIQALHQSYEMLDMDLQMYTASIDSLRQSDTGHIGIDIYGMDKKINSYEREVRHKVMTHLALSGTADLPSGLALVSIVIDIERIGDYTKNIYNLAEQHQERLTADALESELKEVESGVTTLFGDMVTAFKTDNEEMARTIMANYKGGLSSACDQIQEKIIKEKTTALPPHSAAAVALYVRFLKRVAAHSRNIVTSLVNPFPRLGYKEKKSVK